LLRAQLLLHVQDHGSTFRMSTCKVDASGALMIEGAQSFTQALDRSSGGSSSAQQQPLQDGCDAANDSSDEECDDAFDSLWTGFGETAAAMDCTNSNTNAGTTGNNNAGGADNDYDFGGDGGGGGDDSSDDDGCADVGGGYDYDGSAHMMDTDHLSSAAAAGGGSSTALQVMFALHCISHLCRKAMQETGHASICSSASLIA
jgi:hypothetical protein